MTGSGWVKTSVSELSVMVPPLHVPSKLSGTI